MSNFSEYRVKLGFDVDTKTAKAQLQEFQNSIQNLGAKSLIDNGTMSSFTNDIMRLSAQLQHAFDFDTGKLNLNRLAADWEKTGDSAEHYLKLLEDTPELQDQLVAMFRNGNTSAIALTKTVNVLWEQLKRTAKIQLSYGILNSLTGAFRDAYTYAQDLNKSLTSIQIVTQKSTDEMVKFAKQANAAAKSLSTTTTEYTDASLIYYQQGLTDSQVKERTDITVKLANVTGESADEISSYMTSIWNNFAEGTDDLEHFADVITKLGATTASSSEEIATGLGEFSAVAKTVGLDYEYAASALATVVAQTRQSAETVGTSFKTIFARLESLNLGETLDDDTTLTKYTEALQKVGVSIKLQDGQLKDMNDVLDQLGEKWSTLNDQQKNGLAYTVAGARQYTYFLSLMNNWDKVKTNIDTANNSDGSLQEQQDIYAKSWEAAADRVKAAWEGLYDDLIDDQFFINLTNLIADFIEGIDSLVKSLGGISGLLPLLVAGFTGLFHDKILQGLSNTDTMFGEITAKATGMGQAIKAVTEAYKSNQLEELDLFNNTKRTYDLRIKSIEAMEKYGSTMSEVDQLELANNQALAGYYEKMALGKLDQMGDMQNKINSLQEYQKILQELQPKLEAIEKGKQAQTLMNNGVEQTKIWSNTTIHRGYKGQIQNFVGDDTTNEITLRRELNDLIKEGKQAEIEAQAIRLKGTKFLEQRKKTEQEVYDIIQNAKNPEQAILDLKEKTKQKEEQIEKIDERIAELRKETPSETNGRTQEAIDKDIEYLEARRSWVEGSMQAYLDGVDMQSENILKIIEARQNAVANSAVNLVNGLSTLASTVSSFNNLWDSIDDDSFNISSLLSTLMTLSFFLKSTLVKDIETTVIQAIAGMGKVKTSEIILAATTEDAAKRVKIAGYLAQSGWIWMLAITAAIVGLTLAFKAIQDSTPEAKLEKFKTAAEEANTALENLQSTIDDFNNYTDTISKLTPGTLEYTQAIMKANEALLTQLDELGMLDDAWAKGYLSYDSQGRLQFSKEGQDAMLQKQTSDAAIKNAKATLANNAVLSDTEKDDIALLKTSYHDNALQIVGDEAKLDAFWSRFEAGNLTDAEKEQLKYNTDLYSQYENYYNNSIVDDKTRQGNRTSAAHYAINGYSGNKIENTEYGSAVAEAIANDDNFMAWLSDETISDETKSEQLNDKIDEWIDANTEKIKLAEKQLEAPKIGNEGSTGKSDTEIETYELDADAIEEAAQALQDLYGEEKLEIGMAKAIVTGNEKLNDGYADLIGNYESYIKKIQQSSHSSTEYQNALKSLRQDITEIADLDTNDLSDSFLTDANTLKLVKEAAEGSLTSLTELKEQAAQSLFDENQLAAEVDDAGHTLAYYLQNSEVWNNLEIGVGIEADTTGAINNLVNFYNEMLKTGQMTADQVNDALDAIGWEPEITYAEIEGPYTPGITYYDSQGNVLAEDVASAAGTKLYVPEINPTGIKWKGSTTKQVSTENKTNAKKNGSSSKKQAERYKYITQLISKLSDELDDLSDSEDRAFGADKLSAMDSMIDKYNQLIAANQVYLDQANEYLEADRAKMEAYGAEFDENGIITEASYQKMFAAHGNTEDSSDTWSTDLSNYESSLEKVRELESEILDYQNKIYDTKLEKITYTVEFKIDADEFALNTLEFIKEQLDDITTDAAEQFAILGKETARYANEYNTYKKEVVDLLDLASNGNGQSLYDRLMSGQSVEDIANELNLTEEAYKELNEAVNKMQESATNMKEQYQELLDGMNDFFDAWDEKFEKITDRIEHLANVTSKMKDIIDLVGKDSLGISDETIKRMASTASTAAIKTFNANKAELEDLKQMEAEYRANGWDTDTAHAEDWENLMEKVEAAEEAVLDAESEMAQSFQEELETSIDLILENWEDAVSGMYESLEDLSDAFDRANDLNDLYMDTYEQAYNISKLTRNISKSINDTDSVKSKQQLSSLMDEINKKQQAGVKLSEYEYQAYEKQYEMMLAIQALEDAKNAKNTVRMTRDSEGNLGYVYTADQDAIDEAQQNYDDAAYAYAQLNENEINDLSSSYISLMSEYSEAVAKAKEEHRELTDEETAYFTEKFQYIIDQMQTAFDFNTNLIGLTSTEYWDLQTSFEDTVLSHVTGFKTLNDLEKNYNTATTTMLSNIKTAVATYNSEISVNVELTDDNINKSLDEVQDELDQTDEDVDNTSENFQEEFQDMEQEALNFEQTYANVIESAIEESEALGNAVTALGDVFVAQVDNYESATSALWDYYDALSAVNELEGNETPTSTGDGGGGKTYYVGSTSYSSYEDAQNALKSAGVYNSDSAITTNKGPTYYVVGGHLYSLAGLQQAYGTVDNWMKKVSFDTGGYTGEWGDEGKVAVLHQKELVLNSDDTTNFLGAINIVRDLADTLKLKDYGANADLSTTALSSSLGEIQQNVVINADFPNAVDHTEISLAFDDLLNRASQLMNQRG